MTSEQESIPVLTQIYVGSEPPVLSPAFFEFAMAQLKPFLDKAITEAAIENQKETIKNEILDELRSPLVQQFNEETVNALEITKQSLIRDTGDFLDKTKADLTTEIPKMYQVRAKIFQAELIETYTKLQEQSILQLSTQFERLMPQLEIAMVEKVNGRLLDLQTLAIEKITGGLQEKITDFHQKAIEKIHHDLLHDLPMIYESIVEKANQDLAEQLKQLQEEASQVLSQKMYETLPSIYELASAQIKTDLFTEMSQFAKATKFDFETALKGEVPELEQLLKERIHEAFAGELPLMRQEISTQVNEEIEALIKSVRLVVGTNQQDLN